MTDRSEEDVKLKSQRRRHLLKLLIDLQTYVIHI